MLPCHKFKNVESLGSGTKDFITYGNNISQSFTTIFISPLWPSKPTEEMQKAKHQTSTFQEIFKPFATHIALRIYSSAHSQQFRSNWLSSLHYPPCCWSLPSKLTGSIHQTSGQVASGWWTYLLEGQPPGGYIRSTPTYYPILTAWASGHSWCCWVWHMCGRCSFCWNRYPALTGYHRYHRQ